MLKQADRHSMVIPPITRFGWVITNEDNLSVEWDSKRNIQSIRERIQVLTEGCSCTSGCSTRRCGCKKKDTHCSIGCDCTNCLNLQQVMPADYADEMMAISLKGNGEALSEVETILGKQLTSKRERIRKLT